MKFHCNSSSAFVPSVNYFLLVVAAVTLLIKNSYQGFHPIPYALSPVYLQYLENVETRFYNLLKERKLAGIDSEDETVVQRYLSEYVRSVGDARNTSGSNGMTYFDGLSSSRKENSSGSYHHIVSSNPILSLQMINRFVKYFKKSNIYSTISSNIIEKDALPGGKEVEDAMEALLRLQYVYDLDAHEIANGILHGTSTNAHLSARECFELGKFAQESAYFTLALQWFDVTLTKLQKADYESDPSLAGLKKDAILKAIKDTIEEHNEDYEENMEEGDMYSFSTPIQSTNYSRIAHLSLRKRLAEELTGKLLYDEKNPKYYQVVETNMMALCDGKNLQSEKIKARLNCYLDTSRHPYWRINPLKIEVLNETPRIIQLYNVFSDAWILYLKTLSHFQLERAPQPPEATPRTAAYAWFEDTEIPAIPVSKTVEFITGLNVVGTKASEALQVAAYAFGGHVEAHYDSRGPEDPEFNVRGDRVTTFLVYLSEVEVGGRTAFPLLGISIKPIKNSAILWYTNLKNGEIDDMTLHTACPVIKGHKWRSMGYIKDWLVAPLKSGKLISIVLHSYVWISLVSIVATKWTHINENVLKRPCGLTPEE